MADDIACRRSGHADEGRTLKPPLVLPAEWQSTIQNFDTEYANFGGVYDGRIAELLIRIIKDFAIILLNIVSNHNGL
jgi:hypothetical protein